jgi:hypothetical protein
MNKQSINQSVRSSQLSGWPRLFLPLIACLFMFIPDEVHAQSQKGYWIWFTPSVSPFVVSGKMFEVKQKYSCQVNKVSWHNQVFVKPGDPAGKDGTGRDLAVMSETSLRLCSPKINEITSISIDERGYYYITPLGTIKTVAYSDTNGTRWYNVNILNASVRVMTGGTNRGYRVLANINYTFSETLSGQNPQPTYNFGGFQITSYRIIEPTIGLRRLSVSEEKLRQDIANGIHPPQSAVLGDLVGALMTFQVRR